MSLAFITLVVLFVVYVVSLFGSALPASRALLWLVFLLVLLVATIAPGALRPVANALHVEFLSNLILAGAVVFLVLQVLTDARAQYLTQNQLRLFACSLSAEKARSLSQASAAPATESVLVILPCFNEEESLPTLLPQLAALHAAHPQIGFCVVDDASRDRTPALLSAIAQERSARHPYNLGVSGALLTGFLLGLERNVSWFVQCDADGQHPIDEIPRLIEIAERERLDLLIGSRFVLGEETAAPSTTGMRRLGSKFLVGTLRVLFPRLKCTDPTSGFRVYSTKAARTFVSHMPERYPEPEMLAIAAIHKLRVAEAPVVMKPRETGVSSIMGFGAPAYMFRVLVSLVGHRLRMATNA